MACRRKGKDKWIRKGEDEKSLSAGETTSALGNKAGCYNTGENSLREGERGRSETKNKSIFFTEM